jgi:hypothetical protein
MIAPSEPAISPKRLAALLVLALLVLAPSGWIAWSLSAASIVGETVRSQALILAELRQRLTALAEPGSTGSLADPASLYLPGGTPAIAGAALQRIVANAVEAGGGRLTESEFAPVEPAPGEPSDASGRVNLRVSFDSEIVGLQRILFELETGVPILTLQGLIVQSPGEVPTDAASSPPLRVEMLVGGYWDSAP